ncbi:phosphate/phosphite/phosphonate ABC transporter substrate-binding protein [Actinoalloteichus hymeniacidonis]|uniref:Phosphate/phosphite/phosphonate ABC transporter, periplasmic binding protein n=1 Tax=Actinoalloteichus hymeniacidonis TaxID=340345 RepID=A0AAC9MWD0_9PSEU|nr:phosphate/phosphite/phosphonate ABC transporter substrate-binding protein [Actinoalloteichus hymeniacidonis]AOS62068.1 phosphate/phosphite/phosphonate ABC transporter, periplasmic binding protein [Actinoalloteichus hymeniacidonis]MBB5909910.1 phosphonate transport system substrate-binding protein [Actinoalloteichus hymeniacidonis]
MKHLTRSRRAATAAAAFLAAAAVTGCGASAVSDDPAGNPADPDTLVFAAVPAEESSSLQQSYDAVIAMLEQETGKTIEFRQATDYAAVIEGQLAGQVHIAQYGPLSFVLAQSEGAQVSPVGAYVDAEGDDPGYVSYGFANPDAGIESIEDFAGRTVCFVEPNSTSGYLYPSAGLIEAGIDPEEDITAVYAGSHDAAVLEVAAGRCDAGFAFDSMVDNQLIDSGDIAPGDIEKVWKSPIIPGSPAAISDQLAPELRETLSTAFREKANSDYLLANGFCEGDCPIGDEDAWGYAAVDDSTYEPVREVCDVTQNQNCLEG